MPILGFLDTAASHVPMFDALVAQIAPDWQTRHLVDPSLLDDALRDGAAAVADRVSAALAALAGEGAARIVSTCSTLGPVAEAAPCPVPVVRADRPMAADAVRLAYAPGMEAPVAVIAALPDALASTLGLLREESAKAGMPVAGLPVLLEGAWDRWQAGDVPGYLDQVERAAREAAGRAKVVLLAQASMAPAADRLADVTATVLTSARSAVQAATASR